jgi:hypothetical protein
MRTGGPTSPDANTADNEDDDAGEYLFAPQQAETVFQYPGTPALGSMFSSECSLRSFFFLRFCGVENGERRVAEKEALVKWCVSLGGVKARRTGGVSGMLCRGECVALSGRGDTLHYVPTRVCRRL